MNEDTTNLLKECNSGCKMAIGSMKQVLSYVDDSKLQTLLNVNIKNHQDIEDETSKLLFVENESEKEPPVMASAFSHFMTKMKMEQKASNHQVSKIMMDGCNMGIQSISEYKNKYSNANEEAKKIAEKLISIEEEFMHNLEKYQ